MGIGEAYPCSASAKNTTVFTRSGTTAVAEMSVAAAFAMVDTVSATKDGGEHGADGMNLPLSRLSRYSAACNKAAMLIFDGEMRRLTAVTRTYVLTHTHTRSTTQSVDKKKKTIVLSRMKRIDWV